MPVVLLVLESSKRHTERAKPNRHGLPAAKVVGQARDTAPASALAQGVVRPCKIAAQFRIGTDAVRFDREFDGVEIARVIVSSDGLFENEPSASLSRARGGLRAPF
jgi:hypothetical protein